MSQCPRCGEPLVNNRECDCGWRSRQEKSLDPNHGQCSWMDHGERCNNLGTLCPSTTEPSGAVSGEGTRAKLYCAWHYTCLTSGTNPKDQLAYENFLKQERAYEEKKIKHDPHLAMIKGLVFLGAKSMAAKKADPRYYPLAKKLKESGWTPNSFEMPKLTAEETKTLENEKLELTKGIFEGSRTL